jgi:imidazolonepropionase-like amidohydrolase
MAEKGVWWSLQPFVDDGTQRFAEGSASRAKELEVREGTDAAYRLARQYGIKTAFGSDALFSAQAAAKQGEMLTRLSRWYSNPEILRMATSGNAELLALSGPRAPYPGKLGVVETGALADLLLVNGDPVADIHLVADPDRNFVVIIKDGKVYKNTLN